MIGEGEDHDPHVDNSGLGAGTFQGEGENILFRMEQSRWPRRRQSYHPTPGLLDLDAPGVKEKSGSH